MMRREDWDYDDYLDWADQERIVRQEVNEMQRRRREKEKNEEQKGGTI